MYLSTKEIETYKSPIQLISFYFEAIQWMFDSQHEEDMCAKARTVIASNLGWIKNCEQDYDACDGQ